MSGEFRPESGGGSGHQCGATMDGETSIHRGLEHVMTRGGHKRHKRHKMGRRNMEPRNSRKGTDGKVCRREQSDKDATCRSGHQKITKHEDHLSHPHKKGKDLGQIVISASPEDRIHPPVTAVTSVHLVAIAPIRKPDDTSPGSDVRRGHSPRCRRVDSDYRAGSRHRKRGEQRATARGQGTPRPSA